MPEISVNVFITLFLRHWKLSLKWHHHVLNSGILPFCLLEEVKTASVHEIQGMVVFTVILLNHSNLC